MPRMFQTGPLKLLDRLAVLTVLAAMLWGLPIVFPMGSDPPVGDRSGGPGLRMTPAEFSALADGGQRVGHASAPVIIVVFFDYRCGFCVKANRDLETLLARYPDHLAVVYKHFVDTSGAYGRNYLVPEGAECAAEQDWFVAFHEAAFANKAVLTYARGDSLIARAAGIPDPEAFLACVRSRRYFDRIRAQRLEGLRVGVGGTPTMFANGMPIVGAASLPTLDSLIVREFPRTSRRVPKP